MFKWLKRLFRKPLKVDRTPNGWKFTAPETGYYRVQATFFDGVRYHDTEVLIKAKDEQEAIEKYQRGEFEKQGQD